MEKVGENDKIFEWDKEKYLNMSADYLKVIEWYAEESFVVHPDFRIHTGAIMTMGLGEMQ